ncbi:CHAT domain-containing protein [Leptolyngbya sp. FACHB-541]|uniref:CHAT domain-containing protein n=1 Tax=Leptolyngbya sp. FACHB-541 TaxID=2692810 RepID=UPI001689B833|nr:CHAT domain-containing protein [Leptolyngbya sp. FACHB-541]MBD1998332.1 CHAT domain-containing protein [Leptolyngbya sp. FACHB-541]
MIRKRLRSPLTFCLLLIWSAWLCVVTSPSFATLPALHALTQEVSQAERQTLEQQAKTFYDAGRFTEAIAILQQAIQAYQQQGDTVRQAIALSNLALTYHQLGNWTQANQAIANSLNLLDQANDSAARRLAAAQALDIQGRLQFAQGQAEQALATWQQAAQDYEQLNDRDRLIRNQIEQSRALQTLGFYQRAIMLLTELEQTLQAQPNSLTKVSELRSLGEALRLVGSLDQSQQRLQDSLAIAQQVSVNSSTAEVAEAIALIQLSLGNTARSQQDHAAALNWYQQAATGTNSATVQLQANLNRFSLLIETAQTSDAQSLLPQIQHQLEDLPPNRTTVYAQINLAQSLAISSSTDAATLLSTAAQQSEQLGDRRTQSYALGLLGGLYEKTQQWSSATDLTRQALQLALSTNATDVTYLWQWQLGRILKAQAEQGIDPANNRVEAIALYEEALKTLQSLRLDLASMNPDQQFSFRESVEPTYRQLIELLLQPAGTINQENLIKARRTLESLQTVELQNFFREACLDVPIAIDRIVEQTSALSADQTNTRAAIIYPIILPDSLEVILKLPNQPNLIHYSTMVGQAEVEKTLTDLRHQITQPETQISVRRLSQQVYDWLIRPAEAELSNNQVSTLVFVLDGFLKNIPMAALHDGERYLVETYAVALTPGLELPDPQPLERQQMRLLFAGLSSAIENFSPLTAVEQEKDGILAKIPRAVILLNQEFTAEALQTQIEQAPFQIIHLATHGEFSSDRNKTFIRALDRRIDIDELNRILKTRQAQPGPIELLTLSACQTAEGDERAALGLAGVAVRAGARSTLASLWSIDDQSSAFLMIEFYRQLVDNPSLSKSQALRQAQLTLINHPNYSQPSYWAPYVLLGNWL